MAKRITSKKAAAEGGGKPQVQISAAAPIARLEILVSAVFIFMLAFTGSMDNTAEKWTGLISAIIILFLLVLSKRTAVLKESITPLFYSVFAYVVWGGLSTFYAASGKFAIFEFSKLLTAFCVYLIVLFFTDSNGQGFRRVSFVLASAGAFFGVISVDAASSGLLSKIFKAVFGVFTIAYEGKGGFEQGIRIPGIFGNPNTYAGFMAIAVLLSVYLVSHASGKKDSRIAVSLLAINSLAYLLAFSMGSLFMFFIACLIMIWLTEKGNRVSVFLLMVETAAVAFLFVFISMTGLGKTGIVSFIPVLALILNAIFLYLLDTNFRSKLSEKLTTNGKLLFRIVILIIIAIAVYLTAALFLSNEMTLKANETSMRAIYVPGGEYTLSVESTSPVNLVIESQNQYDLMRHTSTALYSGTSENPIPFQVPDDSRIVQIHFTASNGEVIIHKASFTGAENGKLHLNYPMLPNIIANRIQNLFANENAVQRVIFFEDGLKLFMKSPVIGRGLGGFENGVYSVQDFFYQTKYAHNHYIQVLCDLGFIGFLLFLSILIFSVDSIRRAKTKRKNLFTVPVLAACTFQIFGQALTDAVWSTGVFLAFAAAILALITKFCSEPVKLKGFFQAERLKLAEKTIIALFAGIFIILLSGNLYAQAHARAGVKDFNDIERLIFYDHFEYNDYKLAYIINAPKVDDKEVRDQAEIYADELMRVESNSLTPYIAAYKFQNHFDEDAIEAARYGIQNNKSNPTAWIQIFSTFEDYIDPVGPNAQDAANRLKNAKFYSSSVLDIYKMLQERNKDSLDDITLPPYNNAFIGKLLKIEATHSYNADLAAAVFMTHIFDSTCAVDANQDNLPDDLTVVSGSAQGNGQGCIWVSQNTVLDLNLYHKLGDQYIFKVETETPQEIKIAWNGQDLNILYTNHEAYAVIALEDNTQKNSDKITVSFPSASKIDSITFTTKLDI